ncbi:MAG: CoB--CoM heterodisulfide reductase iron-sulfur subunit A family protein [Bacteroidetes bacterium]|nr:MAG: CoB--CoM heterodisulfide reductase iron-sulfur subunit A family protein [Bacteroidota bacterium]
MDKRIGVYICQCGSNISDWVDVEKVREVIREENGVVLARVTMFACADSAQKEIVADIQQEPLDAIVVASCSPKLHLYTFRSVAERGGLNPFNYVQVNIREQDSWAHSDQPTQATQKAIRLIRAGIAKVQQAEPLTPVMIPVDNTIAIHGAGVAGMRAALELADLGTTVYLIEKEHFVGGRVAQWGKMSVTNQTGEEIVTEMYRQVIQRPTIHLFTGARILSATGSIGKFTLKLKLIPRYLNPPCDAIGLKKAMEACPIVVDDEFNFNLTKRKAIFHNFKSEFPALPVIDMNACTRCGECLQFCTQIDLDQQEKIIDLQVGSILLTTGFNPYEPKPGEFGYREIPSVITLQQFKRLLELSKGEFRFGGKKINRVAFIYCVGSREVEGEHKYCARYCCTSAIHAALQLREEFHVPYIYHLTRGIRTYGKQEILYEQSSVAGDVYFQFVEDDPPNVEASGDHVKITIHDLLTANQEVSVTVDLLVLVTGMVPRENDELEQILKVPLGRDRFYNEVHPKLRPVETVLDGVFIAGCCQGPRNIHESVSSSLAAVSKIYSLLNKGEIQLEPTLAIVNPDTCEWCGKCVEGCPFDAIEKAETDKGFVARVIESNCKGCGMCTIYCPTEAIDIKGFTNQGIRSMIDAMAGD